MLEFKKILCPIDLDSAKESAISEALSIARQFEAEIHFLYINTEQAGYRTPYEHEDQVALAVKKYTSQDLLEQVKVTYAVSKGDLGDEVKKYGGEHSMDLIITGHHHHSKWHSILFDTGDVNIIDSVSIPVLVIPARAS